MSKEFEYISNINKYINEFILFDNQGIKTTKKSSLTFTTPADGCICSTPQPKSAYGITPRREHGTFSRTFGGA
jgi:hypothetical protein